MTRSTIELMIGWLDALRRDDVEALKATPRRSDVPGGVAEVAPQLAQDGRHREARERSSATGVPPVRRLHESDRGDLDEILERLRAMAIADRKCACERKVALDQRFAGRR
jgi:hypothetical protein